MSPRCFVMPDARSKQRCFQSSIAKYAYSIDGARGRAVGNLNKTRYQVILYCYNVTVHIPPFILPHLLSPFPTHSSTRSTHTVNTSLPSCIMVFQKRARPPELGQTTQALQSPSFLETLRMDRAKNCSMQRVQ